MKIVCRGRGIGHPPEQLGDRVPRHVTCEWCGAWAWVEDVVEWLRWTRDHAACLPVQMRDALEAGWGQPGVHGGGLDPNP